MGFFFSLLMTWLRGEEVTSLQRVVLMLGPLIESQKKGAVSNVVEREAIEVGTREAGQDNTIS